MLKLKMLGLFGLKGSLKGVIGFEIGGVIILLIGGLFEVCWNVGEIGDC